MQSTPVHGSRTRAAAAALAALVLLAAPPTLADDGNYQNFVIGERASGMGGAATATAVSVEAAWYNPAGLALTPQNSLSLSASAYGFASAETEDGWFPGTDAKVEGFLSFPTAVGAVSALGDRTRVAFSAFIPDRMAYNDLDAFPGRQNYFKANLDDVSVWFGPSIGVLLTPRWSAGCSLFGVYRAFSYFREWTLGEYGYEESRDFRFTTLGVVATAGVRRSLGEHFSAGLLVRSPSLHLSGSGDVLGKAVDLRTGEGSAAYSGDVEARTSLPAAVRAGVAWERPRRAALALDLTWNLPTTFTLLEGRDQSGQLLVREEIVRRGTLDANLGAEYYVVPGYPVRAGFFTGFSSAEEVTVDSSGYPPHVDKYGVTLSVGRETESTSLNVGLTWVNGSGEMLAQGFDAEGFLVPVVADRKESALLLTVGSSYYF